MNRNIGKKAKNKKNKKQKLLFPEMQELRKIFTRVTVNFVF